MRTRELTGVNSSSFFRVLAIQEPALELIDGNINVDSSRRCDEIAEVGLEMVLGQVE